MFNVVTVYVTALSLRVGALVWRMSTVAKF